MDNGDDKDPHSFWYYLFEWLSLAVVCAVVTTCYYVGHRGGAMLP